MRHSGVLSDDRVKTRRSGSAFLDIRHAAGAGGMALPMKPASRMTVRM
jgi:hypothetical protein